MEKIFYPRRCATLIGAMTLGVLLAGCSSDRLFGSSSPDAASSSASDSSPATSAPSAGGRLRGSMADFFLGSTSSDTPVTATGSNDVECPGVDIRPGASTLTIPPGGGDSSALTLRYQGTIGQMARACSVVGGTTMRMKVGVQGRIILGPAGGPGKLELPLRYAVVHEGPEPKTIVTKFYKVAVTVPDAQPSVPFMHIDEDITFPMPKDNDLDFYVVYVGFDPTGEKPQPAKKPAPKPAPKPRSR